MVDALVPRVFNYAATSTTQDIQGYILCISITPPPFPNNYLVYDNPQKKFRRFPPILVHFFLFFLPLYLILNFFPRSLPPIPPLPDHCILHNIYPYSQFYCLPNDVLPVADLAATGQDNGVLHYLAHDRDLKLLKQRKCLE